MLLHEATFVDTAVPRRLVAEMQAAGDQIVEAHEWPGTWAWRLKDIDPSPPAPAGLTLLDPKTFDAHASEQSTRIGLIFDGNLDTRWMTGTRQAGTEWVEIRLPRPTDVRRLEIVGAGRTLLDYPRHLTVDSVDSGGAIRTLFDDSVVDRYVESVAFHDQHPSIAIDLAPNDTSMLRIAQTGHGGSWWSIHELKMWAQQEKR